MTRLGIAIAAHVFALNACARPTRSAAIIDEYRMASCVNPSQATGVTPPTRGWNAALTVAGARALTVKGAEMVGGNIRVQYGPNGPEIVAVQPGDYIYPSDVRVDGAATLLFVKADGWAGGLRQETWLYKYDLRSRQELTRLLVDPTVLPPECPMPK